LILGRGKITAIGSIWAMVKMPVCVAALDDVPDIDLTQSCHAGEGRLYRRIISCVWR